MNKKPKDYLALALDNCTEVVRIQELVEQTKEYIGVYKVGLEQFIRFGPDIISNVRAWGAGKIFLDLKLHDIPNTVAKAITSACTYDVDFLTVHTMGGKNMLEAASEAAQKADNPPKIVGVTILTSIDQQTLNTELQVNSTVDGQVKHLAQIALDSKLNGIVCSAADLPSIKETIPNDFEVITPGIRLKSDNVNDQKRIATPKYAIKERATLLVIGRPITAAENPVSAAQDFLTQMEKDTLDEN